MSKPGVPSSGGGPDRNGPEPPRDDGSSAQRLAIEERQTAAYKLRREGCNYQDIAERLGVSLGTAHNDVRAVRTRIWQAGKESAEEATQTELERLDEIVASLRPLLRDQSRGPRAAEVLLAASKRRSELMGLDAPKKTDLTVKGVTLDEITSLQESTGLLLSESEEDSPALQPATEPERTDE